MLFNVLTNAAARIMAMFASIAIIGTTAAPTDHGSYPSLSVFIRDAAGSYARSETMARDIERRGDDSSSLVERSSARVQACYTSSCTDCYVVWDGSFTSNSACLSASNTACLIISNLDEANVEFWNKAGCSGSHTIHSGCTLDAVDVSAPGTNSLGVHTGC